MTDSLGYVRSSDGKKRVDLLPNVAAVSLLPGNSGTTYAIKAISQAITVTLPALSVSNGVVYKFVVQAAATIGFNVTITCPDGGKIYGNITSADESTNVNGKRKAGATTV